MLNRFAHKFVKYYLDQIANLLCRSIERNIRSREGCDIGIGPVDIQMNKKRAIYTFGKSCVFILYKMRKGATSDLKEFHIKSPTAMRCNNWLQTLITRKIYCRQGKIIMRTTEEHCALFRPVLRDR